jgi:hypothetical protein
MHATAVQLKRRGSPPLGRWDWNVLIVAGYPCVFSVLGCFDTQAFQDVARLASTNPLDPQQNTLGRNYPYAKYKPGRFDRWVEH